MKAIGIDLGTTNSVVAYINPKGQPEVISSSEGGRTIPSVFCITPDGTKLVGKPAVDQELTNAKDTIRSIKRQMGFSSKYFVNGVNMSPEEISSEILKKIKKDAENYLGETVDSAVITVPAYFNSDQRQATKIAGELAGLKVLRIINEPTAASLAYGLDQNKDETVLVFDLGGGTFDVTILKITDDGVFEVQSTSGDTRLGGDDFDDIIKNFILHSHGKYHFNTIPLSPSKIRVDLDADAIARIRESAEQAKIQLSSSQSTQVNIPYVAFDGKDPIHIQTTITRERFVNHEDAKVLTDKIQQCMNCALTDAKMDIADIDQIVFVGGSTRIPLIGELVEKWTGKKPNHSINPDEAVAIGAAIQVGVLTGESNSDILLLDVNPLSLGIETLGGVMTKMISRNTTIPTDHTEVFSTAEDNQEKVDVKVYQGERPQASSNNCLGEFHLLDILPAPRGIPQIEVTFAVDANGILSVKAKDVATDNEKEVTITGSSSLSAEDVSKILQDAKDNEESDKAFLALNEAKSEMRYKLLQMDSILRDMKEDLEGKTIDKLTTLKIKIDEILETDNTDGIINLTQEVDVIIQATNEQVYKKADNMIMGD